MNLLNMKEFFVSPNFFSPPDGAHKVVEGHGDRTLRIPSILPSSAGATMGFALAVALAGAATFQELPIDFPGYTNSVVESRPQTRALTRKVRFEGAMVPMQLEVEHWPDNITLVRLEGSSLFGEGSSLSKAIAELGENIEEFARDVRAHLDRGTALGGQVRRDWNRLQSALT